MIDCSARDYFTLESTNHFVSACYYINYYINSKQTIEKL